MIPDINVIISTHSEWSFCLMILYRNKIITKLNEIHTLFELQNFRLRLIKLFCLHCNTTTESFKTFYSLQTIITRNVICFAFYFHYPYLSYFSFLATFIVLFVFQQNLKCSISNTMRHSTRIISYMDFSLYRWFWHTIITWSF